MGKNKWSLAWPDRNKGAQGPRREIDITRRTAQFEASDAKLDGRNWIRQTAGLHSNQLFKLSFCSSSFFACLQTCLLSFLSCVFELESFLEYFLRVNGSNQNPSGTLYLPWSAQGSYLWNARVPSGRDISSCCIRLCLHAAKIAQGPRGSSSYLGSNELLLFGEFPHPTLQGFGLLSSSKTRLVNTKTSEPSVG